jgi:hypothetical protein
MPAAERLPILVVRLAEGITEERSNLLGLLAGEQARA